MAAGKFNFTKFYYAVLGKALIIINLLRKWNRSLKLGYVITMKCQLFEVDFNILASTYTFID
jgi:hypothetical protein